MDLMEDDFGWQKDVDAEGNDIYHPDVTAITAYMEMLSHGIIPELEWKSPGRRQPLSTTTIPIKKPLETNLPSTLLTTEAIKHAQPAKPNPTPLSAFDFDDGEMYDASANASLYAATSLLKVEPKKRMVATLDGALQAIHGGIATSKPEVTPPGTSESPAKKPKFESTIPESTPQNVETLEDAVAETKSSAVDVDVPPAVATHPEANTI
ncbi:hypothetical protein RvY_12562 [Ramazzottius varieornatus]|uniref:Uncharacterized protein n=1 Tax=Ramazzottius varieornatus TaxID=947166 RepID=A0A1D1VTM9_RAMVA|nr:hypothetical protein RvY_12562 [Ramazzottius varieornatus]